MSTGTEAVSPEEIIWDYLFCPCMWPWADFVGGGSSFIPWADVLSLETSSACDPHFWAAKGRP